MRNSIPSATVSRLPLYLRVLCDLPKTQTTVSSDQLATVTGANSAQVRKDLSYLGTYGVRGVGYDVAQLRHQIERALGLTDTLLVAIIGAGNLGSALANYKGFNESGFTVAALFDTDPQKVGTEIGGMVVHPISDLETVLNAAAIVIGVIATPANAAQEVADRLAAVGVKSILNFAPTVLRVPEHVQVRRVDLSTELQILSFHLREERRPA